MSEHLEFVLRTQEKINALVGERLTLQSARISTLENEVAELRDELHELATKMERRQSGSLLEAVAEVQS